MGLPRAMAAQQETWATGCMLVFWGHSGALPGEEVILGGFLEEGVLL